MKYSGYHWLWGTKFLEVILIFFYRDINLLVRLDTLMKYYPNFSVRLISAHIKHIMKTIPSPHQKNPHKQTWKHLAPNQRSHESHTGSLGKEYLLHTFSRYPSSGCNLARMLHYNNIPYFNTLEYIELFKALLKLKLVHKIEISANKVSLCSRYYYFYIQFNSFLLPLLIETCIFQGGYAFWEKQSTMDPEHTCLPLLGMPRYKVLTTLDPGHFSGLFL